MKKECPFEKVSFSLDIIVKRALLSHCLLMLAEHYGSAVNSFSLVNF